VTPITSALFVDTSAWYAAADSSDSSHRRATSALGAGDRLVTTWDVVVETWLLVRHRLGRDVAEQLWSTLRNGAAAIETVTEADREHAWATGRAFADLDFSVVDRTSFAVMERLGVHRVATFDHDFSVYRFGLRRDKAFVVVG